MRREIFFRRYRLIEEHNKKYKKKIVPFKIMATELSDRTDQEIHSIHRSNFSAKRRLTGNRFTWRHVNSTVFSRG